MESIASRALPHTPKRWHTWDAFADPPKDLRCGDGVRRYGHVFVWTKDHMTAAELAPLRRIGDAAMDAAYEQARGKGECAAAVLDRDGAAAAAVLDRASRLPPWVDLESVGRGQRVFARYLSHASVTLFYMSLVGGFSAAVITKVLFATGYLAAAAPKAVLRRLLDTGLFIFDVVLDGPRTLLPGGRGFACCVEVRSLHASVRGRLRRRGFDEGAYGVPVNQEDMAVTLLAFSYNVLVGIEFLGGARLPPKEEADYLHLWRYLGFLLGVDDGHNPCVSYAVAKARLESIILHILEPDGDSRKLARGMLAAPSGGDASGAAFAGRAAFCRAMIGDELADGLGLPRAPAPPRIIRCIRLYLRCLGFCCRLPVLGLVIEHANRAQMRAVRALRDARRNWDGAAKRHAVAATVDAPVATCPYRPG